MASTWLTPAPHHRRLVAVAAVVAAMLAVASLVLMGSADPVLAQDDPTTTSLAPSGPDSPAGNILPRPNSGTAPDSPNDPGGWQQYMVFALIGLGLLAIVALATRESRRIRRAQGRYPA